MEQLHISETTQKIETNVHKSIDLLRKKRYLEATRQAAKEQMACYQNAPPETAASKTAEECRRRLAKAEEELTLIRCAYAVLTDYQRDLLDTFFVENGKYCADRLCEKYYKERSALYRDRRKALHDFALAAFGDIS